MLFIVKSSDLFESSNRLESCSPVTSVGCIDADSKSDGSVGQAAIASGRSDCLDIEEEFWKENSWAAL
jgi:hypothetical protein